MWLSCEIPWLRNLWMCFYFVVSCCLGKQTVLWLPLFLLSTVHLSTQSSWRPQKPRSEYKVSPQHSLQQLRRDSWVLTAKSLSLLNYFLPQPTPPKRSISEWENSGGIAVVGWWGQGLSDGKDNIYLAGIKHCVLVLLIRSFTHKFVIQSRGRKEKEWEGRCFVFVTILQWFLSVFLSALSLQLCDLSFLLLLIPGILSGDFTGY